MNTGNQIGDRRNSEMALQVFIKPQQAVFSLSQRQKPVPS
jgi:hypothetical protein